MSNVQGRCLCGHVAYEYNGDIGPANYCHCEDCRRCTGSASNVGVRFHRADFRITSGCPKGFTKRGESGTELTRHFCPDCGCPIYTSSPKHPKYVYVKAGTLDDPAIVRPTHQNWLVSAVWWHNIDQEIRSFQKGSQQHTVRPGAAPDAQYGLLSFKGYLHPVSLTLMLRNNAENAFNWAKFFYLSLSHQVFESYYK